MKNSGSLVPDDLTWEITEAWDNQQYADVVRMSGEQLLESPLDSTLLLFNGISNFYYGITLVTHDERQAHLDASLSSLRKLAYNPPAAYEKQIWYVLGKVYFHKGRYFYDLAEEYLYKALDSGYEAEDILEYLGLINLDFGKNDTAIGYLQQAIAQNPRDVLYYTVAEAYEQNSDYLLALEYYQTSGSWGDDSYMIQESNIGQGRVLVSLGRLEEAERILTTVIENNSQAAEAYFYLGEIYSAQGDTVRARASWREAYNQDRSYTLALERLSG